PIGETKCESELPRATPRTYLRVPRIPTMSQIVRYVVSMFGEVRKARTRQPALTPGRGVVDTFLCKALSCTIPARLTQTKSITCTTIPLVQVRTGERQSVWGNRFHTRTTKVKYKITSGHTLELRVIKYVERVNSA